MGDGKRSARGGNLLNEGTIQYGYSPRGRLVNVTNGATVVQSRYNAFGQRVEKSNGDVFTYDEDGHLNGEYSKSTGRMQREIVYLGDEPVALLTQTVTGTAPSQVVTPNVFYIFSDHLGTPRMITQATDNAIRWRWDEADPFGLQPPNENPSGKGALTFNLRMPGQYYDRESNLFYNYFRDYDPQTGRYVQSDPIGLNGGSNTYNYVNNSPVSKIDPTGELGLIGAGIGAGVDLGLQLFLNGGQFECVDWTSVGVSAVAGALTGGLANGSFALKAGSNRWGATRKWLAKDIWNLKKGQEVHHWLIEQGSTIGKMVPDRIKNQPWNLNPMPSNSWHDFLHNIDPLSRTVLGAPGWAQGAGIGAGIAGMGAGAGSNCACQ